MRKLLTLFAMILLAGCGGGGQATLSPLPAGRPAPASNDARSLTLKLQAEDAGANRRVVLVATDAVDLYQLAGTLTYDSSRYQLVEAASAGGLGEPDDSYFMCQETEPGRLDFAYTRRFYGPGVTGEVPLLDVVVSPSAQFSLADFAIDDQPGELLARDSAKRELAIVTPEVQQ